MDGGVGDGNGKVGYGLGKANQVPEAIRKGIERASITAHPNGIPHGPHPGTYEGSIGKKGTEELAVMVDTFRPLRVTPQASELEDKNYHRSWTVDEEPAGTPA